MKKLTKQQETMELLLKGWQDLNINLLRPSNINKENNEMPIKLIKGSIRFREDLKVYETRLTLNGTRKSIYDKNKNECIKKANAIYKKQIKQLKFIPVKKEQSLFELLDFWYDNYKKPYLAKTTLPAMKNAINCYIKKGLNNKPINSYTVLEIDKFLDNIPNTRTKETVYTMINEFFKFLFNKDIIKKQIHDKIKKYKHKRKEGNFLTQEQRVIFLEKIEKIELRDFFKFIYYTGARKTGAINLSYEDVDLINNKIHIPETKTKESDRIIPLPNSIRYIFENDKKGKVFQYSDRKLKNNFNELEKLCGFRILLKDLRTTFATRLREKGVNEEVIAKWLGHTNTTTTKKFYIKIDPNFELEQSKLL